MAGTTLMSQYSARFLKNSDNDNMEMMMDLAKPLCKQNLEEKC